jgi:hypothetical protein
MRDYFADALRDIGENWPFSGVEVVAGMAT